jgi:hypothetical protein
MKLVTPDDNTKKDSEEFYKLYKHSSPTKLKRMTDLDIEINNILSTPIDLETKSKLYSQALRKFLSYKKQHLEDTVFGGFEKEKTSKVKKPIVKKKRSSKKKKTSIKITGVKVLPKARITPKKKKIKTKQPKAPKKGKPLIIEVSSDEEIDIPKTSKSLPKKSKKPIVKKEPSDPLYEQQMQDYLSYIKDGKGWENYNTNQ